MSKNQSTAKAWPILATAFTEGACVLIIEIAGARALGAYYGASLRVWTAQITATLLFLALGYGLGGRLGAKAGRLSLPAVFWIAGLWLATFAFWRVPVLGISSRAGVELGALLASAFLFGVPLLCLGAVSPLLIQRLSAQGRDASSASGSIFFTNTMGGLAGGWICALVLIPHIPLRLSLAGTGVFLALLGLLWAWTERRVAGIAISAVACMLLVVSPRPSSTDRSGGLTILRTQATGNGMLQVADSQGRELTMMVDGVTQGGIDKESGDSIYEFTDYLDLIAWHYHPKAKVAVLLGLGSGSLARKLDRRGIKVTAVELEPAIAKAARDFFGLPTTVAVAEEDARAWLRQAPSASADLIFLDTFAGEVVPWHLTTREAFAEIKRVLKSDGRLLVNTVSSSQGGPGLDRLKSTLLVDFPGVRLWMEEGGEATTLINATLIGGEQLVQSALPFPGHMMPRLKDKVTRYLGLGHVATGTGQVMTDELSDADQADAELRLEWRHRVLLSLGPEILGD